MLLNLSSTCKMLQSFKVVEKLSSSRDKKHSHHFSHFTLLFDLKDLDSDLASKFFLRTACPSLDNDAMHEQIVGMD